MANNEIIKPGDSIDVNDIEIVIGVRRSVTGLRWTWIAPAIGVASDAYCATAQEAIADARRTLDISACRHARRGWCPDCHDAER